MQRVDPATHRAAPGARIRSASRFTSRFASELRLPSRLASLALGVLLAGAAASADAITYTDVRPDQSTVGFTYAQMGVKMDGRFKRLAGQLSFDPAQPARARVALDVDLASIDTGLPELDREAAGKAWFDVPAFPTARFVAEGAKPLGGNRFEVAGKLTIKGRTRDIVVPATFATQGALGVFEGAFTIRRGDFAIGEGAWSAVDVVAGDVQVRFRIAAAGR